jgi:hypothetical protein
LDAGRVRVPSLLITVKVAPKAIHSGLRSEMGLAVAMLPPRVPVFLIWRPVAVVQRQPTQQSAQQPAAKTVQLIGGHAVLSPA